MAFDHFVLRWHPDLAMYERAIRAKRRATRAAWLEWGLGLVAMVIFLPAALAGDLVSWGGVALALLWGTGLWGFGYRWLFYWRRHPQLFAEVRQEVSNDGVLDEQAGVHQRFPWSHWNTLLYTRDGLMLMTARSGNVNFLLVPRRGLLADQEWAELVALVQKQVQQHPRASLGAVSAL